ncbi:enolase C-terminal domain-like protein [Salinibacterium sp.]|uniref:enolase C-terminal domain-like protein n=2 Tax=Salinibacterium sp. TaxID=1915057 RepID=UPI0037C7E8AE
MSVVSSAEALFADDRAETAPTDAVRDSTQQMATFVRPTTDGGITGFGCSDTLGNGETWVLALLRDHLHPQLRGKNSLWIKALWHLIYHSTCAIATGAITSLAVASINTAPRDLRLKRNGKFLLDSAGSRGVKVPLDFSRVGGITPWLTVAHLAEACEVSVYTHCRTELDVSLACAVPNGHFVGRMPPLRTITKIQKKIRNDTAMASRTFGLGIYGDLEAIDRVRVA